MNQYSEFSSNQFVSSGTYASNANYFNPMQVAMGGSTLPSGFNPFYSNVEENLASVNDACGVTSKSHQIASIFGKPELTQLDSSDNLFAMLKGYCA
jgi:hypothetical protein